MNEEQFDLDGPGRVPCAVTFDVDDRGAVVCGSDVGHVGLTELVDTQGVSSTVRISARSRSFEAD
jgi:hypothetical protein